MTPATAVLPTDAATTVINALKGEVTANIGPILILVGTTVGLSLALRWFSKKSKVHA